MENQVEQVPFEGTNLSGGVQMQSMDDFMKETDPDRNVGVPKRSDQPPTKKQKKNVDADALAAEEEAVRTMGDTNWIGKLNGEHILICTVVV
jgi:hypothetical protein